MDRRALIGLKRPAPTPVSGGGGGGSGGASYFRLPTITATIVRTDGRRGVMTVEVGLDVPDAALRTRAQQSGPRLSSAYNTAAGQAATMVRPGYPPDIEGLVRSLQQATDRTLGRAGARLLIGTVMVA